MDHHVLLVPPNDKFADHGRRSPPARAARSSSSRPRWPSTELVEQFARGRRAGRRPARRQDAAGAHAHAGRVQRGHVSTSWSPPTSPPAASTSTMSRWSCTSIRPTDQKDYLHRAGRTARAGATGTVVTLVLPRQRRRATALLAKAGVTPTELRVRAGDAALAEVTGARQPSGVPVRIERSAPSGGSSHHGGRPGRRPQHEHDRRPRR